MKLTLQRIIENNDSTFGVIYNESNNPLWLTLEKKYLNNMPNQSSIPIGQYKCNKITHNKYGLTFVITDVPNRTGILFHSLNFSSESEGCIGLGKVFYKHKGRYGIARSRDAMNEFREYTNKHNNITLIVK